MKMFIEEVASPKREIIDLKYDININEKELFKIKIELQELNAVKQQQSENKDLKKQLKILRKENATFKIKLVKEDQINHENTSLQRQR